MYFHLLGYAILFVLINNPVDGSIKIKFTHEIEQLYQKPLRFNTLVVWHTIHWRRTSCEFLCLDSISRCTPTSIEISLVDHLFHLKRLAKHLRSSATSFQRMPARLPPVFLARFEAVKTSSRLFSIYFTGLKENKCIVGDLELNCSQNLNSSLTINKIYASYRNRGVIPHESEVRLKALYI